MLTKTVSAQSNILTEVVSKRKYAKGTESFVTASLLLYNTNSHNKHRARTSSMCENIRLNVVHVVQCK